MFVLCLTTMQLHFYQKKKLCNFTSLFSFVLMYRKMVEKYTAKSGPHIYSRMHSIFWSLLKKLFFPLQILFITSDSIRAEQSKEEKAEALIF